MQNREQQPGIDVRIVEQAFDWQQAHAACNSNPQTGAIASFVGQVRELESRENAQHDTLLAMHLEHYEGMTERVIEDICRQAAERWPYQHCIVRHRVGQLAVGEPIVLVMVASSHRDNAFAACEFVMDFLKTQAPFWKKAIFADGEQWVDAKQSDDQRSARWSDR